MNSEFEKAALAELKAIRLLLEQGAREREDLEHRIREAVTRVFPFRPASRKRERDRLIGRLHAVGEAGPELERLDLDSVSRWAGDGGTDSSSQGG